MGGWGGVGGGRMTYKSREGREDVGEHDDTVRFEGTPRLHGELDGDVGRLRTHAAVGGG